MKINTILLTNLSLVRMLFHKFLPNTKGNFYYYDLYGRWHGLTLLVLIKLFGRPRLQNALYKLIDILNLPYAEVPHAQGVDDYHVLQIQAHNDMTDYVYRLYKSNQLPKQNLLFNSRLDADCLSSLQLKELTEYTWLILENIRVLKAKNHHDITIRIAKNSLPPALLEMLVKQEKIQWQHSISIKPIINAPIFVIFIISGLLQRLSRYCLRQATAQHTQTVIAEFVDPQLNNAQITAPNFFFPEAKSSEQLLTYVRQEQEKRFKRQTFSLPETDNIRFLSRERLAFSELGFYLKNGFQLIFNACKTPMPFTYFLEKYRQVCFATDFSALLKSNPQCKVHLYNTFPNGKCSVRQDSGLITGLCRYYSVRSCSYQTRAFYVQNHYYYFDTFDAFAVWGSAWVTDLGEKHFIRDFYTCNIITDITEPQKSSVANNTVVLFTSDVEIHAPQHHTKEYVIDFLQTTLEAIHELNQTAKDKFQIIYKPKQKAHIADLFQHPNLKKFVNNEYVPLSFPDSGIHETDGIIRTADFILSIGFTSPGFDAIALGIPSVYYTPYKYKYNTIFHPDSHLTVHDKEGIKAFLSANHALPKNERDKLVNPVDNNSRSSLINLFLTR